MNKNPSRGLAVGLAVSIFAVSVAAVPLAQAWAGPEATKVSGPSPNSKPTDKPTPPIRGSWNNGKKP